MKKGNNGEMVPNCVPLSAAQSFQKIQNVVHSDEVEEILSSYNSSVGEGRIVALSAAATVAARSYDAYSSSCSGEELRNAVLWETHSFLEFATLGNSEDLEIMKDHYDLLPPGHPQLGLTASAQERASWVSGAPELEDSSRDAITALLYSAADSVDQLHASSRVRALIASGSISSSTAEFLYDTLETITSD
jgi:hypothetical protein